MTPKQRCECGGWRQEQKDGVYVCHECGKPMSIAEEPKEDE